MKKLFYLILPIIILLGCQVEKQKIICTGNCLEVNIKGRVFEAISKKGINGVHIDIEEPSSMGGFFVKNRLIEYTQTDSLGNYDVTFEVDSSLLSYGVYVEISKINNEYFFDSFSPKSEHCNKVKDTIDFSFYKKASLNLKVTKTSNTPYQRVEVITSSIPDNSTTLRGLYGNFTKGQDTTYNLETHAGVFTKVKLRKITDVKNNVFTEKMDSVLCKKGEINTLELEF
jgi:hypothetical protein